MGRTKQISTQEVDTSMSIQLYNAGVEILAMGYYKNENARSGDYNPGHEDAIASVLDKHEFKGFTQKDFPKLQRSHLKEWWESNFTDDTNLKVVLEDLPAGSYVLQPGGTQSFPDILVRDCCGRFVALECKSGKGTHPMWNDSTPKPGAAYIMSSGKLNQTTLFMGEDVITEQQQKIIDDGLKQLQALAENISSQVKALDKYNRGFILSSRKQFFQQGGKEKTNYFTHVGKEQCEKNVLEFLSA